MNMDNAKPGFVVAQNGVFMLDQDGPIAVTGPAANAIEQSDAVVVLEGDLAAPLLALESRLEKDAGSAVFAQAWIMDGGKVFVCARYLSSEQVAQFNAALRGVR